MANLSSNIPGGDLIDWLQQTVLLGQNWNDIDSIPETTITPIQQALRQEIEKGVLSVEDCPHVAYKPIEALFEGDPKPFQIKLLSVPPFPLHIFPETISHFLTLTAQQYAQVPDFLATTIIGALGGLIGRSTHLQMRPNDSWKETANCWCVLVGPPAAKKSPMMRRIFDLFKPLESRANQKFVSANKSYQDLKKNQEGFSDPPPSRRRYITDDITTPKLRELLNSNPRGIILRSDELKGQLQRLDKFGNEGDRSFMMSCWSGLEDYCEDRMCRESLLNIPLTLTWIGYIPPSPLQRYLREAMGNSGAADGFMQRFQFICYPDQKLPFSLAKKGLDYFQAHARRCYDSVTGGAISDAEIILDLLKKKCLPERFKAQDIYHQGLGGLSDSEKVRAALALLQDYNWLAVEKVKPPTGRQHEFWNLHPEAFKHP